MKNLNLNNLLTVNDVEEYRKMVNEACDKRVELLNKYSKAINLGKKTFGAIKENIENISPLLFESNEGKNLLNRYKKCISSSKDLSNLYSIYETIRKAGKDSDANFIINEISSIKSNKKSVEKEIEPLRKIMEEAYIILGDKANELLSEGCNKTDSAIEYVYTNNKNATNIAEYGEAYKIIREYIEGKNNETKLFETKNDKISKMISSFNEKFAGNLNEEGEKMIRDFSLGENQEQIFENYKNTCLEKINEMISTTENSSDKERLVKIQEQINGKKFSKETFTTDLHKLVEINNII